MKHPVDWLNPIRATLVSCGYTHTPPFQDDQIWIDLVRRIQVDVNGLPAGSDAGIKLRLGQLGDPIDISAVGPNVTGLFAVVLTNKTTGSVLVRTDHVFESKSAAELYGKQLFDQAIVGAMKVYV